MGRVHGISVYFSLFDTTSFSIRFFQMFLPNFIMIITVLYIMFYIKTYSITGKYSYIYKNIYQFIQKEIRSTLENNYPILSDKLAQIFYNLSIMRFIRTSSLYFYFDKTSRS